MSARRAAYAVVFSHHHESMQGHGRCRWTRGERSLWPPSGRSAAVILYSRVMYDLISRSLGALASPATLLGSSVLLEVFAALVGYHGLASACLGVSAALVVLFGVLSTANWVAFPLEARFAANPTLPDRVAGIVALGGMERLARSAYWGRPTLNDPGPIGTLVALGRRYPEARLVFTGGGGNARISEATVAKGFIHEIGAGSRPITYEDRSRNTLENPG